MSYSITPLILLIFISLVVGVLSICVPNRLVVSCLPSALQKYVVAYALLFLFASFAFRFDLPINLLVTVFWIAIATSTLLIFLNIRSIFCNLKLISIVPLLIVCLPVFIIAIVPLILNGTIYVIGIDPPDLNGFSASYLSDNNSWATLLNVLDSLRNKDFWLKPTNQWALADYRTAVALDTLILLNRWGAASVSALFSTLTYQPIWVAVYSVTVFAFILNSLVIYFSIAKEVKSKLLCVAITFVAQGTSLVLLWGEGLFTHITVLPIFSLISVNLKKYFDSLKDENIYIGLAILIAGALVIWSESIVILGVLFLAYAIINSISLDENLSTVERFKINTISLLKLGINVFVIGSVFVVAFILLTMNHIFNGMPPGILVRDWSFLSIVVPLQTFFLDSSNNGNVLLKFNSSFGFRLFECVVFLFGTLYLKFSKNMNADSAVACAFTVLLFSLLNQTYVFWNVVTILQPAIIFGGYILIQDKFLSNSRATYLLKILVYVLSLSSIVTIVNTVGMYAKYTTPINEHSFNNAFTELSKNRPYAILTPSLDNKYQRLGWSGPLYWVNRRHSWAGSMVHYETEIEKNLEIAFYYDCEIEGINRCLKIKNNPIQKLQSGMLIQTNIKISEILRSDGVVDKLKLDNLIFKNFGVEPTTVESPPYKN